MPDISDPFDELINEEAESAGDAASFATLSVGARDWTVDTILDQIKKSNLDLDPAFQRRNAWNDQKRSRFIESLILGVPIPQLVLAEQLGKRGKFLVIDGKQRLLTLAGLQLKDYNFWEQQRFQGLNTLTYLNGVRLEEFREGPRFDEPRRLFGNAPIRCAVLSGTNSTDVFYDIFYRLNSGAVPLSGQELRQVFYRGDFAQYLFDITDAKHPIQDLLGLDGPDPRLFDIELILRYLAIRLSLVSYRGDLRSYLDATMSTLTQQWADRRAEVERLNAELAALIERLERHFGSNVIGRRFTNGKLEKRFNKAVFEVEAYYFRFVPEAALTSKTTETFLRRFSELCEDGAFRSSIEATTKSIDRFRTRFERFRQLINHVYGLNIEEAPTVG